MAEKLSLLNCAIVEPERRQWGAWNFVGFWIADSFNIVSWDESAETPYSILTEAVEYMDDKLNPSRERTFLVAVVALCMDWLHHCRDLYLHDGTNWRNVPYQFSGRKQGFIRHLGVFVAGFQPCRHGLYLVRRTVLDRRLVPTI